MQLGINWNEIKLIDDENLLHTRFIPVENGDDLFFIYYFLLSSYFHMIQWHP